MTPETWDRLFGYTHAFDTRSRWESLSAWSGR